MGIAIKKQSQFGSEKFLQKMERLDILIPWDWNNGAIAVKSAMTVSVALCAAFAGRSFAAGAIDKDYIRSLAAPGKTVLVIEYYDGQGKVVDRKG